MKAENAFFQEMLESLNEDERRRVDAWSRHYREWLGTQPDPWVRFDLRFTYLRWHGPDTYDQLRRSFGAWLEEQHDPRGQLPRLHEEFLALGNELASLGRCRLPQTEIDLGVEEALLRDVLADPADQTAFLVLADWLEERDDPRARHVRLLASVRALGRRLQPAWLEASAVPWPSLPHTYQHFGEPARRVMQLANQEAQRFNHEYIGTQHILLGLLRQDFAVTPAALIGHGITLAAARAQVERLTPTGPDMVTMGKLPQSLRGKASIGFAVQEAEALGHEVISPEHLLLGLCQTSPCTAARVLDALGTSPGAVCRRVLTDLGSDPLRWLRQHPEVW